MKNMLMSTVDRVLLVAHGEQPPTDEEWAAFMSGFANHGVDDALVLVWTEGAAPNVSQRRELTDLLAGRAVPIAVLSSSTLVRGVATAISWFNRKVRVFAPHDADAAITFLGVGAPHAAKVREELESLRAKLHPTELTRKAR